MSKEHKNPFKDLENLEELPPELKVKVMGSINLMKLISGIGELFTIKMGETAIKMTHLEGDMKSDDLVSDQKEKKKS